MCEALIRVVDKTNADATLNAQCMKRGDVVVLVENGHEWSQAELTAPYWRILKVPLVTVDEARDFLAIARNPDRSLKYKRASKFDIDNVSITGQARQWFNDDTRAAPSYTFNITGAQLLALRVVKP